MQDTLILVIPEHDYPVKEYPVQCFTKFRWKLAGQEPDSQVTGYPAHPKNNQFFVNVLFI